MNRREMFGTMGAMGAGFTVTDGMLRAGDHDAPKAAAGPMAGPHAHFCGIHIAKKDPKFQLLAQHYCTAHAGGGHGEGLFQCLLFDSREANAKLLGVEYIISDAQYRALPEAEKPYWHPHTYEVLAGGLIAPAMTAADEMKFMKDILTTWGKTWHTWPDPKTAVPIGEPLLMWALTGDGQVDPKVIAERDRQFNVSAAEIRERRGQALGLEVPKVSLPRAVGQVGRQWTDNGEDRPTQRR